jgi:hypothetical protein
MSYCFSPFRTDYRQQKREAIRRLKKDCKNVVSQCYHALGPYVNANDWDKTSWKKLKSKIEYNDYALKELPYQTVSPRLSRKSMPSSKYYNKERRKTDSPSASFFSNRDNTNSSPRRGRKGKETWQSSVGQKNNKQKQKKENDERSDELKTPLLQHHSTLHKDDESKKLHSGEVEEEDLISDEEILLLQTWHDLSVLPDFELSDDWMDTETQLSSTRLASSDSGNEQGGKRGKLTSSTKLSNRTVRTSTQSKELLDCYPDFSRSAPKKDSKLFLNPRCFATIIEHFVDLPHVLELYLHLSQSQPQDDLIDKADLLNVLRLVYTQQREEYQREWQRTSAKREQALQALQDCQILLEKIAQSAPRRADESLLRVSAVFTAESSVKLMEQAASAIPKLVRHFHNRCIHDWVLAQKQLVISSKGNSSSSCTSTSSINNRAYHQSADSKQQQQLTGVTTADIGSDIKSDIGSDAILITAETLPENVEDGNGRNAKESAEESYLNEMLAQCTRSSDNKMGTFAHSAADLGSDNAVHNLAETFNGDSAATSSLLAFLTNSSVACENANQWLLCYFTASRAPAMLMVDLMSLSQTEVQQVCQQLQHLFKENDKLLKLRLSNQVGSFRVEWGAFQRVDLCRYLLWQLKINNINHWYKEQKKAIIDYYHQLVEKDVRRLEEEKLSDSERRFNKKLQVLDLPRSLFEPATIVSVHCDHSQLVQHSQANLSFFPERDSLTIGDLKKRAFLALKLFTSFSLNSESTGKDSSLGANPNTAVKETKNSIEEDASTEKDKGSKSSKDRLGKRPSSELMKRSALFIVGGPKLLDSLWVSDIAWKKVKLLKLVVFQSLVAAAKLTD